MKRIVVNELDPFCPVCRFLDEVADRSRPPILRRNSLSLLAFCAAALNRYILDSEDFSPHLGLANTDGLEVISGDGVGKTDRLSSREWRPWLGSETTGLVLPLYQPVNASCSQGVILSPQKIDFEMVQGWISKCQAGHSHCSRSIPDPGVHPQRLLDCLTRKVVQTLGPAKYAALSYVWGSPQATSSSDVKYKVGETLWKLPQTIEDAITVTKSLNLRYLWVDRLCIPQDDKANFHLELKSMALIFESAQLTIIAGHGNGANDGLPGVGSLARSEQTYVQVGIHGFVYFDTPLEAVMKESKYITRAWTYQEERSSIRRLYFTGRQVYYECSESQSCESVAGMDKLHWLMRRRMYFRNGNLSERDQLSTAWEHISEVSKRDLTYDSDALNAVLGLLEKPSGASNVAKKQQIYGIPIPKSLSDDVFLAQLLWNVQGTGQRRRDFPSWSWMGWTRSETWPPLKYAENECSSLDFQFEMENGSSLLRLTDLDQISTILPHDMPQVLHVTARTCEVQLLETKQAYSEHVHVFLRSNGEPEVQNMRTNLCSEGLQRLFQLSHVPAGILALHFAPLHPPLSYAHPPSSYAHPPSSYARVLVIAAVNGIDKPYERVGRMLIAKDEGKDEGWFESLPWEVRTVRVQ